MAVILIDEEGVSADCMETQLTLGGKTEDEVTALAAAISTFSDGYNATLQMTLGGAFYTAVTAAANDDYVSLALARSEKDNLLTATAAPQGVYRFDSTATISGDPATAAMNEMEVSFCGNAAVTTQTDLAPSIDCQGISSDLGDQAYEGFGMTSTPAWDGSVTLTDGGTQAVFWYMPKEPSTVPETGETVATVADRLNHGDKVMTMAGVTTDQAVSAACADAAETKIKLGAATLAAAGSVALAAALAM